MLIQEDGRLPLTRVEVLKEEMEKRPEGLKSECIVYPGNGIFIAH